MLGITRFGHIVGCQRHRTYLERRILATELLLVACDVCMCISLFIHLNMHLTRYLFSSINLYTCVHEQVYIFPPVFSYCVGDTKFEINIKNMRQIVAAEGRGSFLEGDGFEEGSRKMHAKRMRINP